MRIRAFGAACLVAAGVFALAWPTGAFAQIKKVTGTISGAAEVGQRGYSNDLTAVEKGKFVEYKDLPSGAIVQQLLFRFVPADSFGVYQLVARKLFERDQSMWLRASRPGLYDVNLRWDRIPHTFSTDARSLGTTSSPGVYALPASRPDSIAWRNAPYLSPIRSQWDPIKVSLGLTPGDAWDFKAEYTRIGKVGDRPMGMSMGSSPSHPAREILEPIQQTVHDLRLSQGYAEKDKRFQYTASWTYSLFQNALKSVQSDNPQQATDSPTTGAAAGRTALNPNNSAHTGAFTGAVRLPARTRVIATISHSWMRQDDNFIPVTTNTALAGRVTVPRASLGGDAQTSMYNVVLNSRPLSNLTISARYRGFDYKNRTAPLAMSALIINDRSVAAGDTSHALPFTRTNADVSASYRLPLSLLLSAGYAQERWTRDPEELNVAHTTESTPRVSLDFTGLEWLALRAGYSKGNRRGDAYIQLSTSENPDSRRFFEADRDRERVNLLATVMPVDQFGVTLNWMVGHDGYPHTLFGLQSDNSALASAEFDWTPSPRFSLGAGYSREDFDNLIHQRYRSGTQLANPTFDWVDHNTDKITSTFTSFSADLVKGKLDVGGNFSRSDASFHVFTFNPLPPGGTGTTASQITGATAGDWPVVTQRTQPMALFVRWLYNPDWALTLRYQVETYDQNDFRTQNPSYVGAGPLSPQIGNFYFLGNYYQNLNVGWVTFLISWKPGAMPFARGRSTL